MTGKRKWSIVVVLEERDYRENDLGGVQPSLLGVDVFSIEWVAGERERDERENARIIFDRDPPPSLLVPPTHGPNLQITLSNHEYAIQIMHFPVIICNIVVYLRSAGSEVGMEEE